jgi:tRNA threonylcarbamoyladenosine biosynthesis protein TsaB
MILALDTSTESASLALYDGERLVVETTWQAGTSATRQLLPFIEQSFRLLDTQPEVLTGVAVALGPGSFNGLRVGLSFAKGLAYALQLPIVGVPTPDILAYPFSSQVLPVRAILKAGRKRVIGALFQTRYGRWQRVGEFRNTTLPEICRETERATVFCGEIDAEMSAYISEQLDQRALVVSPGRAARRAGYLAEMAWKRFQDEPQGDDLVTLQPIYLSKPRIGGSQPAEAQEAA